MSILVDANLLIYATVESAPEHRQTRAWIDGQLEDATASVSLSWPVLYAFVRIVSNPRIKGNDALTVARAWDQADQWRRQPAVRLVNEGPAHPSIAGELLATSGLKPNDVPDVHLAALAIEHGLVLCTHDHGFARFAGLRWTDPLTGRGS